MTETKKVQLTITVPASEYCWDGLVCCEHFDNTGRDGACDIGFYPQHAACSAYVGSYKKPRLCAELKDMNTDSDCS